MQQTVTTACHHCLDPACMNGCPVKAYEKDPVTGIVRHLDDQCIGCQYCVLTCPYEVPQFNSEARHRAQVRHVHRPAGGARGARLRAGVSQHGDRDPDRRQVARARGSADGVLPAGRAVAGDHRPDDRIRHEARLPAQPAARGLPPGARRAPAPAAGVHAGADAAVGRRVRGRVPAAPPVRRARVRRAPYHAIVALCAGLLALGASVFHLGRPKYAFRAIIGLRTSWLSPRDPRVRRVRGRGGAVRRVLWLGPMLAALHVSPVPRWLASPRVADAAGRRRRADRAWAASLAP